MSEELRNRQVELRVEARLTEIFASSGIGTDRAAMELLYLMPKDFLQVYEELFERALKLGGGSATGSLKETAEVGKANAGRSGDRGTRPMVTDGKRYKQYWVVKDDNALEIKKGLDKRLRRIAREIRAEMNTGEGGARGRDGCSRCGKMMADGWLFCAWCGQDRRQ